MKHFLSKVKRSCKRFMTNKSAFSLVELIVVIAIMAVMAAVLAPALLGYVERSRAQKDSSAFDEVVNSVQLSLADQDVYDEMLMYSAEQYSCYVDSDSPDDANKVDIKVGKYYMYSDEERKLDETVYKLDGVMRGVTITFAPDAAASNSATLDLIKGHVNKYLPSGKKTYGGLTGATASPKLADIPESELYNNLRATIGDKITINSQTYRNSEYTIFISMGTTGGNEAAQQDAIKVWGQFSGTNLPEGSSVAGDAGNSGTSAGSNEFNGAGGNLPPVVEEIKHDGEKIPVGATLRSPTFDYLCNGCDSFYNEKPLQCDKTKWNGEECNSTSFMLLCNGENTLSEGNYFPEFVGGYDYTYTYNGYEYITNGIDGWSVRPLDTTKERYDEPILTSINNKNVTSMVFSSAENLKITPLMPNSITTIDFGGLQHLESIQNFSTSLQNMDFAFQGCRKLKSIPVIPASVTGLEMTFYDCESLSGTIIMDCRVNSAMVFTGTNVTGFKMSNGSVHPDSDMLLSEING